MQIHLIERFQELEPFSQQWNDLLARSKVNCVFLTWEWQSTWWQVFGDRFSLKVVLAEQDGELVGIAPLMVGRLPGRSRPGPTALMMIGQAGDTTAEFFDFIIEPGRESEIGHLLMNHALELLEDCDVVLLERILCDSPIRPVILDRLRQHGLEVMTPKEDRPAYIRLPRTMEEFLASKNKKFRNQYHRSLRRLEELGTVRYLVAGKDASVESAIEVLAKLNRDRWQEKGRSFRTRSYLQFHTKLATVFAQRGWLSLLLLTIDDEPIAADYGYVYGNRFWAMQGGWSRQHHKVSPGAILIGKTVSQAIDRGLEEYDFLGGEAVYKQRWVNSARLVTDIKAFNRRSFKGRLWRVLRSAKYRLSNTFNISSIGHPHKTNK